MKWYYLNFIRIWIDLRGYGSDRTLLTKLKHKKNLIFKLIAFIELAENSGFIKKSLFDYSEFIEIDVGQYFVFILLIKSITFPSVNT